MFMLFIFVLILTTQPSLHVNIYFYTVIKFVAETALMLDSPSGRAESKAQPILSVHLPFVVS